MRIAVTGGIAEGKSTVLASLEAAGYLTASSDSFARDCFLEPPIQAELAQLLNAPSPVEPGLLRRKLSESIAIRRAVNRLMHPRVVARILASPAAFVEVPLLIEACLHPLFDEVWVVTCGPEEQLRRLEARGGGEPAILLMDAQLRSFAKTAFGDVIVRTNFEPETVMRFVYRQAKRAFSS
jgi:dephospho-CoA kinase